MLNILHYQIWRFIINLQWLEVEYCLREKQTNWIEQRMQKQTHPYITLQHSEEKMFFSMTVWDRSVMQAWQSLSQPSRRTLEWVLPITVSHSGLKWQGLYTPAWLSHWAQAATGKRMASDKAAHSSWSWPWRGCQLEAACWLHLSQLGSKPFLYLLCKFTILNAWEFWCTKQP